MLHISSLLSSLSKMFLPSHNSSKEKPLDIELSDNNVPELDPTSFTEARNLPRLNQLELRGWIINEYPLPTEEELSNDPSIIKRMQEIVEYRSSPQLHHLVSTQEEDPLLRRFGAAELVNRKDLTAGLTFLFCLTTDTDYELRKICVIGLGELENKSFLPVLENIQKDDPVYNDAREAILKIKKYDSSIIRISVPSSYNASAN